MPRLLLVRHGQTDWNTQWRYQGQTDTPLNATGVEQVTALGRRLAAEGLDCVYASDLQRAWRTGEAIAGHHGLVIRAEPRLREINLGDWEGSTYSEIEARDPERLARWVKDPVSVCPPGGETLAALASRVETLLDELCQRPESESIVLVSHGGTLGVLLCLALGMPTQNRWRLRLDSASVSELHLYEEGAILTRLNDQHHLTDGSS